MQQKPHLQQRGGGMTLAEARAALKEARKTLAGGESPARTKTDRNQRKKSQKSFAVWAERWLEHPANG
jgi:hypothetical protein